jgi:hypothetical protein
MLDDVDELKELLVLTGGLEWFSLGSRVIITTPRQIQPSFGANNLEHSSLTLLNLRTQ